MKGGININKLSWSYGATVGVMILLAAPFLFSCNKADDGWRLYVVKAGHERCSHLPSLVEVNKNSCDFWYETNDTWAWTGEDEWISIPGTAKIAGFSDGFHREHSCRLGYRSAFGVHVVGLFVEKGNDYLFEPLDTIEIDAVYHCRLSYEDGFYVARQDGKEARIASDDCWWGYRLYPCMAGGYRLSHDWKVKLKFD